MYVKVYNHILDSSLAENRKLRHFFIDLLLCSDPDGNVIMTKDAISRKIKAPMEEVEWGLRELMKKDGASFHGEEDGRRVVPLDGCGYGWKIVNYGIYRDLKTAQQMRQATAERVKRHRDKKRSEKSERDSVRASVSAAEKKYDRAYGDGASETELNKIVESTLPASEKTTSNI